MPHIVQIMHASGSNPGEGSLREGSAANGEEHPASNAKALQTYQRILPVSKPRIAEVLR